jgi:hypothetical protein
MYKEETYFKFRNPYDWSVTYRKDFKTKNDFDIWMNERLSEGLIFIEEKHKEIQVYPQVLKLDLKSPGNSYFTIIERFVSSEDYEMYCQYKLMEGFKVIGSEPYLKLIK